MSHTPEDTTEPTTSGGARQKTEGRGKGNFLIGAASGAALAILAPLFSSKLRPVVRGAIKGGIASGRYIQKVAEGVAEDFQDITAEAKAELDRKAAEQPQENTGKPTDNKKTQ
jgi:hypothetical protein